MYKIDFGYTGWFREDRNFDSRLCDETLSDDGERNDRLAEDMQAWIGYRTPAVLARRDGVQPLARRTSIQV